MKIYRISIFISLYMWHRSGRYAIENGSLPEKGFKVKSIILRYTALSSFYDYLIEVDIIRVNPLIRF
ncbi:Uncharacterised protein [uncultured archaeon]|nr:Uncharacterised protein [uncultured archaeon]